MAKKYRLKKKKTRINFKAWGILTIGFIFIIILGSILWNLNKPYNINQEVSKFSVTSQPNQSLANLYTSNPEVVWKFVEETYIVWVETTGSDLSVDELVDSTEFVSAEEHSRLTGVADNSLYLGTTYCAPEDGCKIYINLGSALYSNLQLPRFGNPNNPTISLAESYYPGFMAALFNTLTHEAFHLESGITAIDPAMTLQVNSTGSVFEYCHVKGFVLILCEETQWNFGHYGPFDEFSINYTQHVLFGNKYPYIGFDPSLLVLAEQIERDLGMSMYEARQVANPVDSLIESSLIPDYNDAFNLYNELNTALYNDDHFSALTIWDQFMGR